MIKDSGSNDYRSRIGFNIYTLAIGTYTIVFEFYPPEMTNIQLSCTASEAYIHKAVQRDFTAYSKLLVQFNNNSKQTPNYIYLTMHGTATATPVQCHLVVYGVKDWSDSVYPGVYDGLDNVMFEYKNGDMEMKVNMDMNNKIISGLLNPIFDSEAMNLGYFTNLFKRNTLELLPVVFSKEQIQQIIFKSLLMEITFSIYTPLFSKAINKLQMHKF